MANLSIEPSDSEIQFYLQDEMPECSVTLSETTQRGPLIYRIQPTQRQRYAIWPSIGVVNPGSTVIVSVVLLERARSGLEKVFEEVGPIAEFRQMDRIVVEWCRAPETVYRQLKGDDSENDFEILSSFWSTKGYEFRTPVVSARQPIQVRFSMSPPLASNIADHRNSSKGTIALPSVSVDESADRRDPSLACDDSLMLSISTSWGDDSRFETGRWQEDRGGHFPKKPSHLSIQETSSLPPVPSSDEHALSKNTRHTVHKFQLQQTLRCGGCYEFFSRNPDEITIPVMSQACGHTICRGCVVRKADEHYSFTKSYQDTVSCPLCNVPHAFSLELHINHSLCAVIALIDS